MKPVKTLIFSSPFDIGYDKNFFYTECHDHNFYELTLVQKGCALHCVNDSIQIIKERDLIIIRPHDAHYFKPYGDNTHDYFFYNIRVSYEEMEKQFAHSKKLSSNIIDRKMPAIVTLNGTDFSFLSHKLMLMTDMSNGENKEYLYYSLLKDFLWLVLNANDSHLSNSLPEWLDRFLINLQKPEVFSCELSEIIQTANASKSYLWKCFKRYLNVTPSAYINDLRLGYAYEKILSGKYKISDVANEVGFNSYNYFVACFKKKYGIMPSELLK